MSVMSTPYFFPKKWDTQYQQVMIRAYQVAKAEAIRIAHGKSIPMKIEFLKPVHWGRTLYNLPGSADTTHTLKSNTAIVPFGVLNEDPTFDYMKWYKGSKTQYIGDWFVRPIYLFEEKEGVYGGNLDQYVFRGDETYAFNCHSTTTSGTIQAWLLAWAVMPVTMDEVTILTS